MTADVLVVGGGIGGTVLAELLGRRGKKVIVLEKSTACPKWTRPEILWPATIEILFSLLPRERWEKEAMLPVRGLEFFNGHRFVTALSQEIFDATQVQPWSTDPNLTRELLFNLRSFELHRGVEVASVLKEKDRVVGVCARNVSTGEQFEVLAEWTVGDDGVNSVMRQACGIEMKTRLFPIEFFAGSFNRPATFPPAIIRVFPNLGRAGSGIIALGGAPLPNGRMAGLIAIRARDFDGNASVAEDWGEFKSSHPALEEIVGHQEFPKDFARIRRPWGHAPRYGTRGAILMGDAAHSVSPAGAQGANMSVADARVLAELLVGNSPSILEEYERRRRPANERSMHPTGAVAFIQGLPSWSRPTPLLFALAGWVGRHPAMIRRGLCALSTAFLEDARK